MQVQSMHFKSRAQLALENKILQGNLDKFGSGGLALLRTKAVAAYGHDEFERLRDAGAAIRDRSLASLDAHIERFEREATRRGARVLFAKDGDEARDLVLEICRRHGIRKAVKSKSMLSEEAGLNEALEAARRPAGGDRPRRIHHPARQGAAVAHHRAGGAQVEGRGVRPLRRAPRHARARPTIPDLTREAREVLRKHFLSADLGISGANFLVAETGSGVIVTNEGNGRMVTTLPQRARVDHRHREGHRHAGGLLHPAALADALGDRPGDLQLRLDVHRPEGRRRPRGARAHVLHPRRRRAHQPARRRRWRRCSAASAAARA